MTIDTERGQRHIGVDRETQAEIDGIIPAVVEDDISTFVTAESAATMLETKGVYSPGIMEIPAEERAEALLEFYTEEVLPLPEKHQLTAWKMYIGDRNHPITHQEQTAAIDARYEFRKQRALANGENWPEAFTPW